MEKAFAYICADAEAAPRLLRRYCRKVYELGYVPICPKLSEAQYVTKNCYGNPGKPYVGRFTKTKTQA